MVGQVSRGRRAYCVLFAPACVALLFAPGASGSEPPAGASDPEAVVAEAAPDSAVSPVAGAEADSERTDLNLLGEVDSSAGESRRNENVQLTLLDNNVLKEINIRMGTTATIVREFEADKGYFGGEFGGSPSRQIHLPRSSAQGVHGSLYEMHQNSAFAARSFFQVGDVKPARTNDYGVSVGTPGWRGAHFTVDAAQQRNTGNVNGNVLVPRLDERTALTTDPVKREIVQQILDSYPVEAPNRTDINPRALNTNSPQVIDNDSIGGRLDQDVGASSRMLFDYRFRLQKVDAFQLVRGQNPNTTTRSHDARTTWNRMLSTTTVLDASIGFNRVTSLIVRDEGAIGPLLYFGRQLETLGTSSSLPIDRAQNTFRYAAMLRHSRGRHEFTAGLMAEREQLNGLETSGHTGLWSFSANFGRDLITNLRHGKPSRISQAFGNTHRGFRRWNTQLFVGDNWSASQRLSLNLGLRFEPSTRPVEVNGLSEIPYRCDCNNVAPTFGFAYRTGGVGVLRGAYGLHYGQIFAATYTRERFNPPDNIRISVPAPDITNPFGELDVTNLDPSTRSSIIEISPDLATPYSHQYNFSWELSVARPWTLSLGYVGSRTHRLLVGWPFNRAAAVDGIELAVSTVNERRPDPRFFDVTHVLNGSRAYYDAAKAEFSLRSWRGLVARPGVLVQQGLGPRGALRQQRGRARRLRGARPERDRRARRLQGLERFRPAARGAGHRHLRNARPGRRPAVEQDVQPLAALLGLAAQDGYAVRDPLRLGRPGVRQCRRRRRRPAAYRRPVDSGPQHRSSRTLLSSGCRAPPSLS